MTLLFGKPFHGTWGFPHSPVGKESACNAGDPGSIPGWGRSPGEGEGYSFQYSGLENSMDYSFTVHGGHEESDTTELLSLHFTSWHLLMANGNMKVISRFSLSFPFSVLSSSYCFLGLLIVSYECRLMYHFSSFSRFEI